MMWFKASLFVVTTLAVHVNSACDFQCVNGDYKAVKIVGMELSCPKDQYCNRFGLLNTDNKCPPCVPKPCESIFSCEGTNAAKIEGVILSCPKNFICNENNPNCIPCIQDNCNPAEKNFECIDKRKFIIDDVISGECRGNFECNKDFQLPCSVCIEVKTRLAGSIENGSMRLATNNITLSAIKDGPCTPERTSNCLSGPKGQYYRCIAITKDYLISELRDCSRIVGDPKCSKSNVCNVED